jgi:hypothetical protein
MTWERTEGYYIQAEEHPDHALRLVTNPERKSVKRAQRETNLSYGRGRGEYIMGRTERSETRDDERPDLSDDEITSS